MSTHAFRLSFAPRGKNGSMVPFDPFPGIVGDIVQNLPGIIGDIGRIFDQPPRPGMPGAGQTPGGGCTNGASCGPTFKASTTCVAPGISDGKMCCPSGMHFSESTKCCVKNRRMNFQNGRAFNRAVRRVRGKARGDKRAREGIRAAAKEMGVFPRGRARQKPCK